MLLLILFSQFYFWLDLSCKVCLGLFANFIFIFCHNLIKKRFTKANMAWMIREDDNTMTNKIDHDQRWKTTRAIETQLECSWPWDLAIGLGLRPGRGLCLRPHESRPWDPVMGLNFETQLGSQTWDQWLGLSHSLHPWSTRRCAPNSARPQTR